MQNRTIIVLSVIVAISTILYANTIIVPVDKEGTRVDPGAVQTTRPVWVVIDETVGSAAVTDLTVAERTYQRVRAAMVADPNDLEISIFDVPRDWNAARFRILAEGGDTEDVVYKLYAGTLGDGNKDSDATAADCEIALVGILTAVIGTQISTYHEITFTSGGVVEPQLGDIATGNESGETVVVQSVALSGGAWADGDAAGTVQYRTKSGVFTNSETITLTRGGVAVNADAYTHAASDLLAFEIADTLVNNLRLDRYTHNSKPGR